MRDKGEGRMGRASLAGLTSVDGVRETEHQSLTCTCCTQKDGEPESRDPARGHD